MAEEEVAAMAVGVVAMVADTTILITIAAVEAVEEAVTTTISALVRIPSIVSNLFHWNIMNCNSN